MRAKAALWLEGGWSQQEYRIERESLTLQEGIVQGREGGKQEELSL